MGRIRKRVFAAALAAALLFTMPGTTSNAGAENLWTEDISESAPGQTDADGTEEPETDAAGAPGTGTDAAGAPGAGTDAAGAPEAGTDAAGAPGAGTDAAGAPGTGTDAAGAPGTGTDAAGTDGLKPEADNTNQSDAELSVKGESGGTSKGNTEQGSTGAENAGANLCIHHSQHTQDCGYSPSEDGKGSPCAYECRICPVEELIAALPPQVTEDNRADVEMRLQEILGLYTVLTEEEADQVDISRCMELQWQLDEASVPVPAVEMKGNITIDNSSLSTYNNKELTGNLKGGEYTLTIDGVTVNLTISDLILYGGTRGTIVLKNGANLTLVLKGENKLVGYETTAAIKVPAGCTLTIKSIDGSDNHSITAIGGGGAAGIGASKSTGSPYMPNPETVGTIVIDSGTVTAEGRYNGPGIGGTLGCNTGDVIINGGVVTATGSVGMPMTEPWGSAGIGGGLHGHLHSITINGGTVTATHTENAADIGAGPNGNTPGDMECGIITINGGTINGCTIGFGRDADAALIDKVSNSSITIGENAILPDCSVKPLPEDCARYEFTGKVYDTSITENVDAVFSIGGNPRNVAVKVSNAEPYRGDFNVTVIMPKKVSADASITFGDRTLTKSGLSLSDTSVNVDFGEQKYQYYSIQCTIYDTKITADMTADVQVLDQTKTVTLKYQAPYSGTFNVEKIPLPKTYADAAFPVTVKAGGNTWTGTTAGSGAGKTLTIGEQKYKIYTLNVTINDARIAGDAEAEVTFLGKTQTVTLKKQSDYSAAFSITDMILLSEQMDTAFPVKVKWGGVERTGTIAAGMDAVKTLTMGSPLQKVKLVFWDSAITQDIAVQSMTVTQNKTALGPDALAGGSTLRTNQAGVGYVEIWVPAGATDISVIIPGLNGGNAIQKEGLEIKEGENEFEMYQGESAQVSELDLYYGNILFDGTGDNLTITYSDENGEHVKGNFSYSDRFLIKQSNAETATDHQIKIQNISEELTVCLSGVNISRSSSGSPVSIESNCSVILETAADTVNIVAGGEIPGVYVDAKSTLTLNGKGTLKASATGNAAAIGGANRCASGSIIINSGVIEASAYNGAGIGGGYSGKGTVIINGGTVTAVGGANGDRRGQGAAIGGGGEAEGNVTINGGIVNASTEGIWMGAAIGGGGGSANGNSPGKGVVTITGGIVTATGKTGAISAKNAAIGGGCCVGGPAGGAAEVIISGGTIYATDGSGIGGGTGKGGKGASAVTITGGTIHTSDAQSPQNSTGQALSLVTVTLDGAGDDDLVTEVNGIDSYGLNDVYPRDGGKLYFYLPENTETEGITAGGTEYVPAGDGGNGYVVDFRVELKDYALTKVYDGKTMADPTADQVTCNGDTFENLNFTWYKDGTETASPVNAGEYVLRVSCDKGSQDFTAEITKKPLTITAQAQTIDYKTDISQDGYTHSGLAEGDDLAVSLTTDKTTQGTYQEAITIASAQITRNGADVTGNYEIAYKAGDLTVNRIAPAVDSWPTAGEITYGQELGDSALTGGNASTGGTFAWENESVKPEQAGQHSYNVTFTPDDSNYNAVTGEAAVTVNRAPLTIRANDQEITYGQSITAGTTQVTWEGICAGDRLDSITLTPGAEDVPGGKITPSAADIRNDSGQDATGNYEITYVDGVLTITRATGTLTVPETSIEKVFGNEEFSLDCSTNGDGKISYVSSDESVVSVSAEGTVLIKGAGNASITVSLAEGANYTGGADETVTVAVAKAAAPPDREETRNYTYTSGSKGAVTVDVAGGLPDDRGETRYTLAVTDEKGILSDVSMDAKGNLVYTVQGNRAEGDTASVTVTAEMANYEDTAYTVEIELVAKRIVEPQTGSSVSVSGSNRLTYGQPLSDLTLDSVIFVEQGTDTEVKGTLAWKVPADVPSAAERTAEWVFTPENGDEYVELTGTAAIEVVKATPEVEAPEAEEVIYHPSGTLDSVGLNGGSATWTVGGNAVTVEGTWGWKVALAVPAVGNNGYTAVFTPKDTVNYGTAECIVAVPVAKAVPYIAVPPAAARITYGDALDVSGLTGGTVQYSSSDSTPVAGSFAWKDGTIKPAVSDSGRTEYTVIFTPAQGTNYSSVESPVTLIIEKAENAPHMPSAAMNVARSCEKVSDVELPESWKWQEADVNTALESGVPATAVAVYTGADQENYKNVSVTVTITRADCDHAHTELRNVVTATCQKKGYSGDVYCLDCGEMLTEGTETDPIEHSGGTATCISGKICDVCGTEYTGKDSANHVHTEIRGAAEAACTADGYTGDTYCADCNEKIGIGATIPATGHDWHITSEEAATTTSEGRRIYTCSKCSQTREESIPKLPPSHTHSHGTEWKSDAESHWHECACGDRSEVSAHRPDGGSVTKAPTETEKGVRTYKCSVCGYVMWTEEIEELPPSHTHSHGTEWKSDAESHWHECACGDRSEVSAHRPDGGSVTKAPTETEKGVRTYKCSVCGYVMRTEEIGKLPPSDTGIPFIRDDPAKEGWKVIREETDEAEDKSTIIVDMNGSAVVPGDVLENICGRDVTLVFDMGNGITWSVNGTSVREGELRDIDFSVQTDTKKIPVDIVNNVTGERYSIQISLAHEGEFGFTAVLSVNLGKENTGRIASLYYYNAGAGNLEFICADEVAEDGAARLAFTHASDYVIVIDEKQEESSIPADSEQPDGTDAEAVIVIGRAAEESPKTGQVRRPWGTIAAGALVVIAGIAIFSAVKKKEEERE